MTYLDEAGFAMTLWHLAERPADAAADWKRERPLMIVLDNYSVHKSQTIQDAVATLEAADIFLVYLPSYSPELSQLEPIWNDVKHHYLTTRSYEEVVDLKRATEAALARKAAHLLEQHQSASQAEAQETPPPSLSAWQLSTSKPAEPETTAKRLQKPPHPDVGKRRQVQPRTTNIQRLAA